ncbi:MAG: hypothetical protein H6757_03250 [Candidatus Omnitrophica bacterium]|nr:hypothetical protein [Candidatus Omnitrophota bacterium]
MKKHHLKTEQIDLTILPEAGCHWPRLQIALGGQWTDLLSPVEDCATILSAPSSLGSYMMAPWSNRIPEGIFEFEGQKHQLRLNFPDQTTIHGDVRKRAWQVRCADENIFEAELDTKQCGDFNFPYPLFFEHKIELIQNKIVTSLTITNTGAKNAPAGFGFHPFFNRQLKPGAPDPVLVLPAEKVYPSDQRCIPTGPAQPVTGAADLRKPKPLGTPNLDHCYTALSANECFLNYSDPKVSVHLQWDAVFTHAVIYVPNDEHQGPQRFFAIEPVTHVTDGFNLYTRGWKDTGIRVLKSGESFGGKWSMTVTA